MRVQSYLYFNGQCEAAASFYAAAVGAEVAVLMRYKDAPPGPGPAMVPPGNGEKVMHMEMRIGETTVMASDGLCSGTLDFQGFSLVLMPGDAAAAQAKYDALGAGGAVVMPFGPTFFSPGFGMIRDRFGVTWTVLAA